MNPHQPADRVATGHRSGAVAVRDTAGVNPHQPAGIVTAGNAATNQPHIVNGAAGITEQTYVVRRRLIDDQAADGMAGTVKAAGETTATGSADRHEAGVRAAVVVPVLGAAGVDVIGQSIVAAQHTCRVDALQAVDVGDLVWAGAGAIATRGPDKGAAADTEVYGIETR
ncbi:hypothetical protein SpAn4DRAFT_5114 [Sporomusa ovata]|uniref:Uncharacterized protein n=1 Tax=Sporomusa ovata TaxID=2378 RepID=A0A0U1L2S6_9FIRM|nr:hypothetical protein SpAn4DRAFT_5114 [Sporomusa ovata]